MGHGVCFCGGCRKCLRDQGRDERAECRECGWDRSDCECAECGGCVETCACDEVIADRRAA